MTTHAPLLEFENVFLSFGGLQVLKGVNLSIPEGGIFGLIGPNGAGKTTIFNLATGLLRPSSGSIRFNGLSGSGRRPHEITRNGMARTFQNIRIFHDLSLQENVMISMHANLRYGLLDAIIRGSHFQREEKRARERAIEILSWFHLDRKATQRADSLSYGDQRKLELARALATNPRLLLLDEPVAGMNGQEKDSLREELRSVSDHGVSVLMIEHDMRFVMGLCNHVSVLNFGKVIAQGNPESVRNNPDVIEAYLGTDDEVASA